MNWIETQSTGDPRRVADFAALASQYSDDEASKFRGGDRGHSPRGVVFRPEDDPFGNAAFTLGKVGGSSEVVATRDGFHIIRLTGLKPAWQLTWVEARDFLLRIFGIARSAISGSASAGNCARTQKLSGRRANWPARKKPGVVRKKLTRRWNK